MTAEQLKKGQEILDLIQKLERIEENMGRATGFIFVDGLSAFLCSTTVTAPLFDYIKTSFMLHLEEEIYLAKKALEEL
jgi:hypothetical protein